MAVIVNHFIMVQELENLLEFIIDLKNVKQKITVSEVHILNISLSFYLLFLNIFPLRLNVFLLYFLLYFLLLKIIIKNYFPQLKHFVGFPRLPSCFSHEKHFVGLEEYSLPFNICFSHEKHLVFGP